MVPDALGEDDGALDGDRLGVALASLEGKVDGERLGVALASLLGEVDGERLGAALGNIVSAAGGAVRVRAVGAPLGLDDSVVHRSQLGPFTGIVQKPVPPFTVTLPAPSTSTGLPLKTTLWTALVIPLRNPSSNFTPYLQVVGSIPNAIADP